MQCSLITFIMSSRAESRDLGDGRADRATHPPRSLDYARDDIGVTARAPCRAIGPTCDVVAMPNAFCIAAAQRRAASSSAAMANSVGPEPLIVQANAPASVAARLTAAKFGISCTRRGSA